MQKMMQKYHLLQEILQKNPLIPVRKSLKNVMISVRRSRMIRM